MGGGTRTRGPASPARRGCYLPVQLGALHQRVSVPVPDERVAVEAAEALGVVLLLPGHLQAGSVSTRHPRVPPPASSPRNGELRGGREDPRGESAVGERPRSLTMTSPLVICSAQPWHSSPKRAQ